MDMLELAPGWRHQPCAPMPSLQLGDGRELRLDAEVVTFNRAHSVRALDFAGASEADRLYAIAERRALLMSWLDSLPGPVVNRVDPSGLAGFEADDVAWRVEAARCGLPVAEVTLTTASRRSGWRSGGAFRLPADGGIRLEGEQLPDRAGEGRRPVFFTPDIQKERTTLLVAGSDVLGDSTLPIVPPDLAGGALALARSVGCLLLEVELAARSHGSGWLFTRASPRPALSTALHLDATARLLERLAARPCC